MGEVIRVANTTQYIESDTYQHVRGFCTCPECRLIWSHRERGVKLKVAMQEARQRYDGPQQCPECGTWSKPVIPGLLSFRMIHRQIISNPEVEE